MLTAPQYTLDELLDLSAQFEAYATLLFCPADHAHENEEMTCEISRPQPQAARQELEFRGQCKTCRREIHAFIENNRKLKSVGRATRSIKYMNNATLVFDISFKIAALQRQFIKAQQQLKQLRELSIVAQELRLRVRREVGNHPR